MMIVKVVSFALEIDALRRYRPEINKVAFENTRNTGTCNIVSPSMNIISFILTM